MKRLVFYIIALLLFLVILWLGEDYAQRSYKARAAAKLAEQAARKKLQEQAEPLPGSQILANYGKAELTVEDDLNSLGQALGNYVLLVKGNDPLPLGANEEIAAALLGRKKVKMPFFSQDDSCFNATSQLIDRWGTPLYFHAVDRTRLDIRSAGPDQKMWTDDDVHRRYDGRFVRKEELNATSLFEAMKEYQ